MRLAQLPTALCVGLAALTWHSSALAISTSSAAGVNGQFHAVMADPGVDYRTHDGGYSFRSVLEWGGENAGSDKPSHFRFDGFSIPGLNGKTVGEFCETPFALGKLYFDNQTGQGSSGVYETLLNIAVKFEDLPNAFNWDYKLSLSEHAGHNGKFGDQVDFGGEIFSHKFQTETGSYRFALLGWSVDDGQSYLDALRVGDFDLGKAKLYGVINPYGTPHCDTTVVPVPAAAWLLGSGLLALLGISRRRA